MAVKAKPEGYHSVTPYLVVDDAAKAIEFYRKAFDAQETVRMPMVDRIGHAELKIGDSVVMLSDEWPDMGMFGPKTRGSSVSLVICVEGVDIVFKRAIDAGAKAERAVKDEFYGDRSGTLLDPFGHRWMISTHVEDVAPEKMNRRMEEFAKK